MHIYIYIYIFFVWRWWCCLLDVLSVNCWNLSHTVMLLTSFTVLVINKVILELRPRDHISDALRQLHWLPVDRRIKFKLCYWCTVHIPAGVQSIWQMFLSQLQSTIADQACVPHLPTTTFYLVFNQDWASGHFPMPGHLRETVYQLTFRTYLTPQLSRNV